MLFGLALAGPIDQLAPPSAIASASSAPVAVQPLLSADGRTITVSLANAENAPFTVNAGSASLSLSPVGNGCATARLNANEHGQIAAVVPPSGSAPMPFTPSTPIATLTFDVPPSVAPGMYLVAITLSGQPNLTAAEIAPPFVYVSTARQQQDTGLLQATRDYVGKSVFLLPSQHWINPLVCSVQPSPTPARTPGPHASVSAADFAQRFRELAARPIREHVFVNADALRGSAWRVVAVRRIETGEDGRFANPDPDFLALEPLVFELVPLTAHAPAGVPTPAPQDYYTSCKSYVREFADPWEARRVLVARSPFDHPEWPARYRDAVRAGNILHGMSHDMVANILGYPSFYGSIDELDRLAHWDYDEPAPSGPSIGFNGDRVVTYDPGHAEP